VADGSGNPVSLDATVTPGSGDSPLVTTFEWTPSASDAAGLPYTVTITVKDLSDESATYSFTIDYINLIPVADPNGPYIANATGWDGAYVTLDGSGSGDPDDDDITYAWDLDLETDTNFDSDPTNDVDDTSIWPEALFPVGQTEISLTVTDENGLVSQPVTTSVTISIIGVCVDIKPGSFPNSINLGSQGVVPVAFLTDQYFDAATIDPTTVTLRGEDLTEGLVRLRGKKEVPMANLEDIDTDGDLDLVVQLETELLAGFELDTNCELGALTYDGFVISGFDTLHIVPE
jgi:hypothetical protein